MRQLNRFLVKRIAEQRISCDVEKFHSLAFNRARLGSFEGSFARTIKFVNKIRAISRGSAVIYRLL